MKSILVAVAAALLVTLLAMQSVPAQKGVNLDGKQKADEADAAIRAKQRKDIDSSYKGAIDRLPEGKLDPWRNLR